MEGVWDGPLEYGASDGAPEGTTEVTDVNGWMLGTPEGFVLGAVEGHTLGWTVGLIVG